MPAFLHAADLHLDSPLRGLEAKDRAGTHVERIRNASRVAFVRLIDQALQRRVAFVVLAGDLYDTKPAFETFRFFHQQVKRLSDAGVPVAIVLGNHDHEGVSPRAGRLPAGVHVMSSAQPESLEIVSGVFVHGQSYPHRDVTHDLLPAYPPPVDGRLNVGLLHTALGGHVDHAPYAPTSPQALAARGYQYWALGHVHVHDHQQERGVHLVFPGNLQGRHAKETGPKGAVFVEYEGARIGPVTSAIVDDVRWHHVEVDAASLPEDGDPYAAVARQVEAATREDRGAKRLSAVRVTVRGTASGEAARLSGEELHDSLRVALDEGVFLEKVRVDVRASDADRSEAERQLAELVQQLAASPDGRARLLSLVNDVRKELRKADHGLSDESPLLGRHHEPMTPERAQLLLDAGLGVVREALGGRGGGR